MVKNLKHQSLGMFSYKYLVFNFRQKLSSKVKNKADYLSLSFCLSSNLIFNRVFYFLTHNLTPARLILLYILLYIFLLIFLSFVILYHYKVFIFRL